MHIEPFSPNAALQTEALRIALQGPKLDKQRMLAETIRQEGQRIFLRSLIATGIIEMT